MLDDEEPHVIPAYLQALAASAQATGKNSTPSYLQIKRCSSGLSVVSVIEIKHSISSTVIAIQDIFLRMFLIEIGNKRKLLNAKKQRRVNKLDT